MVGSRWPLLIIHAVCESNWSRNSEVYEVCVWCVCVCVCVCALLAPLLGCHSQAKLHDRKSKIHFQIVFLLFLVPNSQAVESVCAYMCVCVCVCILIKGIAQVSTVSASRAQPSLALPQRLCILQQRDEGS